MRLKTSSLRVARLGNTSEGDCHYGVIKLMKPSKRPVVSDHLVEYQEILLPGGRMNLKDAKSFIRRGGHGSAQPAIIDQEINTVSVFSLLKVDKVSDLRMMPRENGQSLNYQHKVVVIGTFLYRIDSTYVMYTPLGNCHEILAEYLDVHTDPSSKSKKGRILGEDEEEFKMLHEAEFDQLDQQKPVCKALEEWLNTL